MPPWYCCQCAPLVSTYIHSSLPLRPHSSVEIHVENTIGLGVFLCLFRFSIEGKIHLFSIQKVNTYLSGDQQHVRNNIYSSNTDVPSIVQINCKFALHLPCIWRFFSELAPYSGSSCSVLSFQFFHVSLISILHHWLQPNSPLVAAFNVIFV